MKSGQPHMTASYENTLLRKQDFDVTYRILSTDVTRSVLMQHSFPNWVFASDVKKNRVPSGVVQFGVAPEFLGQRGETWAEGVPLLLEGTARVWIRFEAMRVQHGLRFQIGVKGYFTDGLHLLAECVVSNIVSRR